MHFYVRFPFSPNIIPQSMTVCFLSRRGGDEEGNKKRKGK